MRMQKLELGLSLAQLVPEKINKMNSLNNLGFIYVNQTVATSIDPLEQHEFILALFKRY